MNLIEELLKHKKVGNERLIKELFECIELENIRTVDDLEKLEEKYFTIEGKVLNNDEKLKYYIKNVNRCYFDYDNLNKEECILYKNLKNSLNSNISIQNKIINIIKINILTNREIMFYKKAYDYIINDLI